MTPVKVSWIILTYNRFETVGKAFKHNFVSSGVSLSEFNIEIIWVDNGSSFCDLSDLGHISPLDNLATIRILNRQNLGVAKGYNRGMAMATGDYIVITGCDRIMPNNWLARMLEAFFKVPNMGCVSCYTGSEDAIHDRYPTQRKVEEVNGIKFIQALPFEARMFPRSMLSEVGYFHEGFGLYGYEDCHWGPRFVKIAKEKNLICCTLPDFKAEHLGEQDSKEYKDFKDKENNENWKWELVKKLAHDGYPKFNPYL